MRMDFQAAQAVLDQLPGADDRWPPGLTVAVAALRPMAAYAAGRMADAVSAAEAAEHLVDAASDDHLAEYLDMVTWLCWAEGLLGRYPTALRLFDRAAGVARSTGRIHMVTNLLAGKARVLAALGYLPAALDAVEESVDIARLLGSGHQLTIALIEMCLVLTWSGDHNAALRAGEEAVATVADGHDIWAFWARNAHGVAMITAGRLTDGVDTLLAARAEFESRPDPATVLATCELLAQVESEQGNAAQATRWAELAADLDDPALPVFAGIVALARAHAARAEAPAAAATHAEEAAARLMSGHRRVDAGRALLTAGLAHAAAGRIERARGRLREATEVFAACGARALESQAIRERRRLRERVPSPSVPGQPGGPYGLSPRELEIALLVAQGLTNQKIAEQLFISVRTVETHLSRVFTKLGVSSRAGVAAKMARDT